MKTLSMPLAYHWFPVKKLRLRGRRLYIAALLGPCDYFVTLACRMACYTCLLATRFLQR